MPEALNQPLVSLIVPVYNAAPYLSDLFESLLGQTHSNLQIICVNDGSTDDSLAILQSYAEQDGRVLVVDKPNSGAADTRNCGLEYVKGEYLCFIDSDDFIERDAIEKLVAIAERDHTDVVLFDMDVYDNVTGEYHELTPVFTERVPVNRVFSIADVDNFYKYILGFTVNKLYRSSFLLGLNLRFPRIGAHEDMPFTYIALSAAKSIYFFDEDLYHYRRSREGSLSDTTNRRYRFMIEALLCFREGLKERGLWDACERDFENYALHMCVWKYGSLERLDHLEFRDACRSRLFDLLGISAHEADYYYEPEDYKFYTDAMTLPLLRRIIAFLWRFVRRRDAVDL